MRTKNNTPFLFGAMTTSLRPPEPCVTLIVKGTFRLRPGEPVTALTGLGEQGTLSGDVFAPGDDERRGPLVYASDFADHKLSADLLFRASCHTPGRVPMSECPVRVTVGAWSKTLRVMGRRVWVDGAFGAKPSDPVPFTELPLDWTQAFGGPDFAENPAGKGVGTAELHTLELPAEVVRGKGDRIAPACLAPESPFWIHRKNRVGKEYGKAWQEKRAPFYAEDFDWSYFNAAPPDQRIPYLRGDEDLTFLNMHPRSPGFSATLPALRIRAFVNDDRGRFREVEMRLDTLFADLDREVLTLTWRGTDPVRDDDLADVKSVLIASEPLGDARSPIEPYREELLAHQADPVGFERRRQEIFGKHDPDMAPPSSGGDPNSAAAGDRLSGLPRDVQERVRLSLARMGSTPVPGHDVQGAIAEALRNPASSGPPLGIPRKPGAFPYVPLGHRLRPLRELAGRVRERLSAGDLKPHLAGRPVDTSALDQLEALERDPFIQQLDPYGSRPGGPGKGEPGPGADLSGQDLSGKDLSGKDLSGADLRGAILHRARLVKANLRGAKLEHAILYEADLTEADLTGADLTQANFGEARAPRAILRDAVIERALFDRADLAGADLSGSKGEYVVLSRADLRGSLLRGVQLFKAFFDDTKLEGAVLTSASLVSCRMIGSLAEGADFSGSLLNRSSFERAALSRALFVEARGERVNFRYAVLEGADLRHAIFKDAFFDEAKADGAHLSAASLRGARLYRTSLVRADLIEADLLGADLRKADLTGATLAGASLFGARMHLARQDGCDFTGADLGRVLTDGRS